MWRRRLYTMKWWCQYDYDCAYAYRVLPSRYVSIRNAVDGPEASDVGDINAMFDAAKQLLTCLSVLGSSSGDGTNGCTNALVSLQRLFASFNVYRISVMRGRDAASTIDSATPTDVSSSNQSSNDAPIIAHATLQALTAALEPPSAALLATRSMLQKAIKSFTTLKNQLLRPPSSPSHPSRSSHAAEKRSSSVAEAARLQVVAGSLWLICSVLICCGVIVFDLFRSNLLRVLCG